MRLSQWWKRRRRKPKPFVPTDAGIRELTEHLVLVRIFIAPRTNQHDQSRT